MKSSEIASPLSGRFAGEQLEQAGRAFLTAVEWSRSPAALWILSTACNEIAATWDRPVSVAEAGALQAEYLPTIISLANAISAADSAGERDLMNELARLLRRE